MRGMCGSEEDSQLRQPVIEFIALFLALALPICIAPSLYEDFSVLAPLLLLTVDTLRLASCRSVKAIRLTCLTHSTEIHFANYLEI